MRDLQYLFDKYKQNTNPTLIQQEASNPMYSVWLTASAGTGKTKVLIDRILRILLSGSDVSSILAITFTNAAAFEMKDRVMTTLQEWVFKEDKEIKTELINLYGKEFENKTVDEKRQLISLARSLFTKVLDSPYGLRIETIHAFCKFILKKFPVEAGINPNCSIIASSHDINTILDKIVRSIVINRDDKISDLLDVLLRYQSSGDLFKIIEAIKSEKSESIQKFIKLFSKYNIDFDNFDTKLRPIFVEKYKIDKSIILTDNYSNLVDEYIKFEKNKLVKSFDDLYNLSLEISRKSADHRYEKIVGKTPIERAQKVISFIQKYKETSDFDINDYLSFCNGRGKFNTKGLIEDIPDAERILNLLYNNKDIISNSITQLKYLEFGYAVTKFAYILIQKYSEEKQRQLVLDYDDLLTKTLQLLTKSPGYSEWVLYKLDNGINHILLDEAQDTTPEQWEIIDALSDGFFYSGVTKNNIKTIFVVGDYKQSIYSFQGANIDNFDYYHNKFERKIREHGFIFKNLNLDTSFRSSSPVLSFVNAMLLNKDISSGIISKHDTEDSYIHKVANFDTPGVVELWPVIAEETKKEDYDYWEPKQVIFESTLAKSKLAKLIADKIETLMQSGVRLGDILILVGTRTDASILLHLIKKLIDAKIDIAGVDKIILKDNIIICDLIALAQVCISEYDDLNVAALLKSPFFGFDEERVFDVCYNRGDKTVIQILSEKYPDLYKEFKAIQDMALSGITPFEFFTYILNRNGNWKKCYARAGMETEEIIKEFLSICLSFEQFPIIIWVYLVLSLGYLKMIQR